MRSVRTQISAITVTVPPTFLTTNPLFIYFSTTDEAELIKEIDAPQESVLAGAQIKCLMLPQCKHCMR